MMGMQCARLATCRQTPQIQAPSLTIFNWRITHKLLSSRASNGKHATLPVIKVVESGLRIHFKLYNLTRGQTQRQRSTASILWLSCTVAAICHRKNFYNRKWGRAVTKLNARRLKMLFYSISYRKWSPGSISSKKHMRRLCTPRSRR